jgi:hypothetical protein
VFFQEERRIKISLEKDAPRYRLFIWAPISAEIQPCRLKTEEFEAHGSGPLKRR